MAWSYFLIIIALVIVLFIFVKRPMYEVMFVAFISLCLITGNASNVGEYWVSASRSYLPFTLTGFVIFAVIFEKTGIIQDIIDIIVALVGRFHGGAGYVALLATAAMGSFCGTGPGTAVATGTVTIPTMKRTGYSSELAASRVDSGTCYSAYSGNSGHVRNAQCRNARKIQRLAILDVCVAHMPVAYSSAFYNSFLCDP